MRYMESKAPHADARSPKDQAADKVNELLVAKLKQLPLQQFDMLYLMGVHGLSEEDMAPLLAMTELAVVIELDSVWHILSSTLPREVLSIAPDKDDFLYSPQLARALSDVMAEKLDRIDAELAANPVAFSPGFERRMMEFINTHFI